MISRFFLQTSFSRFDSLDFHFRFLLAFHIQNCWRHNMTVWSFNFMNFFQPIFWRAFFYLAKNKFTWCDFTIFFQSRFSKFSVIAYLLHIQNLSNCCRHECYQSISRNLHITLLRRPQNFVKSSPNFWLALHRTKVRWRFCKILWPSQNVWTLISQFLAGFCYVKPLCAAAYAP